MCNGRNATVSTFAIGCVFYGGHYLCKSVLILRSIQLSLLTCQCVLRIVYLQLLLADLWGDMCECVH